MSSLGKIFLYLVLVLLCGALAAPQAWHLIQALPPDWLHGLIGNVQGMPFHRYLSRSLQVAAILMLWPLLRSLRIRSLTEFGIMPNPRPLGDLSVGLAAGVLCAVLLQPMLLLSGSFVLRYGWDASVLHALPRILMTALVVAAIEEFLFRGVLLGFFRQFTNPILAIVCSSVLFAGIHFLNLPSSGSHAAPPLWWSGFAMLGTLGSALPPWPILSLAFATLFTAGLILSWMTVRTASLWAAFGLHFCWILGQQLFNAAAGLRLVAPAGLFPYFGPSQCNGMVPVGLVPLGSLVIAGVLAAVLLRKRPYPLNFPAEAL
ncbi:MAG: CPBP family intramembrane glutamic endopeptidase [bacterium]